jgi:WD40 repeat protein
VAILAVLSIAAGILAWKKQWEAALERDAKEQAGIEEAKQRTLAQEQSEQKRRLLVEDARSDRLVSEEKLGRGESPAAFAYLARSIIYDSTSTFAAEKAIAALNTWSFATPIAFCGQGNDPQRAQFNPDGERVVIAYSDKTARVWETESGELLSTLQGYENGVDTGEFSADGQRIVTTSDRRHDTGARLWEAQTGKLVTTLQGQHSAQFSPDGQRIVTADNKTARVWESQSGKLVATLQGHEDLVTSAQFSPEGQRIVTASEDKTARVWTILPANAGAQPLWFPDFLHYMEQQRLNSDGELEPIPPNDWLALRARLRQVVAKLWPKTRLTSASSGTSCTNKLGRSHSRSMSIHRCAAIERRCT